MEGELLSFKAVHFNPFSGKTFIGIQVEQYDKIRLQATCNEIVQVLHKSQIYAPPETLICDSGSIEAVTYDDTPFIKGWTDDTGYQLTSRGKKKK